MQSPTASEFDLDIQITLRVPTSNEKSLAVAGDTEYTCDDVCRTSYCATLGETCPDTCGNTCQTCGTCAACVTDECPVTEYNCPSRDLCPA